MPCRYLREEHPGRGNSLCRGPEAEAWLLWLRSKGAAWLEQSEEGEREGMRIGRLGRGGEAEAEGLVGQTKNSEGAGSPCGV